MPLGGRASSRRIYEVLVLLEGTFYSVDNRMCMHNVLRSQYILVSFMSDLPRSIRMLFSSKIQWLHSRLVLVSCMIHQIR